MSMMRSGFFSALSRERAARVFSFDERGALESGDRIDDGDDGDDEKKRRRRRRSSETGRSRASGDIGGGGASPARAAGRPVQRLSYV